MLLFSRMFFTIGGGDPPSGGDPYRYWRIYVTAPVSGSYIAFTEIEMMDEIGGTDVTGSGTAIDSSHYTNYVPQNAFDNDYSDLPCWASAADAFPAWIGYDFGAGNEKAIVEIKLSARASASTSQAPRYVMIQRSDNGSTWINAWGQIRMNNWSAYETRTIQDPEVVTDHRYWRVWVNDPISGPYLCCTEMELKDTIDGTDLTGSGTPIVSSTLAGYNASFAFDDDFTDSDNSPVNVWATASDAFPAFIGYDFGAGNEYNIVEVTYTSRVVGRIQQSPGDAKIEHSDDALSWMEKWNPGDQNPWGGEETRVWNDIPPPDGLFVAEQNVYVIIGPVASGASVIKQVGYVILTGDA